MSGFSGYLRVRYRRPGAPVVGAIFVHQIAHMAGKLSSGPGKTVPVREFVKRVPQLGMLSDIGPKFLQRLSSLAQHSIELRTSLGFRFRQRHLYPAVGVDFALARSLNRQED